MSTFFLVDENGAIAAVERIHPFPSPEEVSAIVAKMVAGAGGSVPDDYVQNFKKRGEKLDSRGREWCYVSADPEMEIGMIEIGFGKWGFPK